MRVSFKVLLAFVLVVIAVEVSEARVPALVKDRFVIGDPLWKEIAVRDDLGQNYDKCWRSLVDILVDKGYEIGFMEKESGYVRTNPNLGVVRLRNNWFYEVKIVAKIVVADEVAIDGKKAVKKLRVQVQGYLHRTINATLRESYSGYDKQVLQDMFNDLQLVFGNQ